MAKSFLACMKQSGSMIAPSAADTDSGTFEYRELLMERKNRTILIKLALLFSMIFAIGNNCVYADNTSIDPVHDDKINYFSVTVSDI